MRKKLQENLIDTIKKKKNSRGKRTIREETYYGAFLVFTTESVRSNREIVITGNASKGFYSIPYKGVELFEPGHVADVEAKLKPP